MSWSETIGILRESKRADRLDQAIRNIDENADTIIANAKQQWDKAQKQRVEAEHATIDEESREPLTVEPAAAPIDDAFLKKRKRVLQRAAEQLRGYNVRSAPTVNLLLGRLEAIDGDFDKALEYLGNAELAEPRLPGLHLHLGQTYLRMRRNEEAVRAFDTRSILMAIMPKLMKGWLPP